MWGAKSAIRLAAPAAAVRKASTVFWFRTSGEIHLRSIAVFIIPPCEYEREEASLEEGFSETFHDLDCLVTWGCLEIYTYPALFEQEVHQRMTLLYTYPKPEHLVPSLASSV
jgi:hypothetical protein